MNMDTVKKAGYTFYNMAIKSVESFQALVKDLMVSQDSQMVFGVIWVAMFFLFWFVLRFAAKPWKGRVGDAFMGGDDLMGAGDDMMGDEMMTGDEILSASDDPILSAIYSAVSAADELSAPYLGGHKSAAKAIHKAITRRRMTVALHFYLFISAAALATTGLALVYLLATYTPKSSEPVITSSAAAYTPYRRSSYAPPVPSYQTGYKPYDMSYRPYAHRYPPRPMHRPPPPPPGRFMPRPWRSRR